MIINLDKKEIQSLAQEIAKILKEDFKENVKTESKPSENYLSRSEAAKALQVTLPTLDDYCQRELIPSYRLRRKILFKRSDIESAINKGLRYSHGRQAVKS